MKIRKGNYVLTISIVTFSIIIITSMLSLSNMAKVRARRNVEKAGDIESYITIADLCFDNFKSDMESIRVDYVVANIDDPTGDQLNYEIYNSILNTIQEKLTTTGTNRLGSGWEYLLNDPKAPINYFLASDKDITSINDRLLDNAKFVLNVESDLTTSGREDCEDGLNQIYISDIKVKVIIEKGTLQIVKEYIIKDEVLKVYYSDSDPYVYANLDETESKDIIESQTITKYNKHRLLGD